MDDLKPTRRIPLPPLPPRPTQNHLVSRFSAETLVLKSPPSGPKAIQRFFSPSSSSPSNRPHSPPRANKTAGVVRPRHSPSPSESWINIDTPKLYDLDTVAPWNRTSFDAEVLKSPPPTLTSAELETSPSSTPGRTIVEARDKLAGAAKEVIEILARKKTAVVGHGHGRERSHEEGAGGSSWNPPGHDFSPPRSNAPRKAISPPRALPEQHVGHKLVDLPPRSDSRNAINILPKPSTPPRLPPPPIPAPTSLSPSQGKPAKSTLRPNSPPSISIPPLNPHPRLELQARTVDLVEAPAQRFEPLVLSHPTRPELLLIRSNEVLVQIDVGGSSHTTTIETLKKGGRGGKLGHFVESLLHDLVRTENEDEEKTRGKKEVTGYLGLPDQSDGEDHSAESSLQVTPSHFEISPNPSPFPFMRYSSSSRPDPDFADDEDCSSPIDPHAQQLFVPIPSFAPPPPPLRLELDPLPASKQVKLVASPSFTSKHISVHPSLFTNSPTTPSLRPQGLSPRSLSYHDVPSSPHINGHSVPQPLPRRLSLNSSTLAVGSSDEFDSSLEPFFRVLRNQTWESLPSPDFSAFSTTPTLNSSSSSSSRYSSDKQDSEDVPREAGYSTEEEDRSRSTFLGVPRGGTSIKRPQRSKDETDQVPLLPQVKIERERTTTGSSSRSTRPPSLTTSESTALTDTTSTSLLPTANNLSTPRIELFLDRTDIVLPSGLGTTYSTILSFLRDQTLPPFLTLPSPPPHSKSTLGVEEIDPTTLSILRVQPALAFQQIAAMRTVEKEAEWLGMKELKRVCEEERERWVEAIRAVEAARRPGGAIEEKRVGEGTRRKGMKERELEGWI